ncbi:MAG: Holliday junction branch migration protein RuvA [bacterium]
MIGFLRGVLLEKDAPNLTIEVNGVGYEVQIPINGFYRLPQINQELSLHIHFVVREDGQFLYGFIDKEQRTLFRSLIKVNGVGPKMALAILSAMEPDVFVRHVLNNDPDALEHIPGVGAKTARRLIVEMKDKVNSTFTNIKSNTAVSDAISALVALGYKPHEARRALMKHEDKALPSEELVRLALKEIE